MKVKTERIGPLLVGDSCSNGGDKVEDILGHGQTVRRSHWKLKAWKAYEGFIETSHVGKFYRLNSR